MAECGEIDAREIGWCMREALGAPQQGEMNVAAQLRDQTRCSSRGRVVGARSGGQEELIAIAGARR